MELNTGLTRQISLDEVETDVLVIGGGGAGARAAIEASYAGVHSMLCSKNPVGRSGSTAYRIVELGGFNVVNEFSEGSKQDYFDDMVQAGHGMADPEVARVVADEADDQRRYLEGLGLEFRQLDGEYLSFTGCFATKKRTLILEGHGHAIMKVLTKELKRLQVPLYEDLTIVELLKDGERLVGALGVYESGEWLLIRAKAVVLGAGGAGGMFALNMNPAEITGDGYALAYRAGAVMTNLEFMQFGLATITPNRNLIGNWLFPLRPVLRDYQGNPVLSSWLPEGITEERVYQDKQKHFPFTTRDTSRYVEVSVHSEIAAGRATPNGGIYLDFTGVTERETTLAPNDREVWEMAKEWLTSRGIDISTEPAEIAVFAHAVNGGVLIDQSGATSLPGLFAAGENAAGPHGADRLGGNMLVTSQVFGARAGRSAAAFASGDTTVPSDRVEQLARDALHAAIGDTGDGTPGEGQLDRLYRLRDNVADVICRRMMVVRSEEGYQECRDILSSVLTELSCENPMNDPEALLLKLEIRNMVETSLLMVDAGSHRRESRGGHNREDFPECNDDDYRKNYFIQRIDGEHCGWFQTMSEYRDSLIHQVESTEG